MDGHDLEPLVGLQVGQRVEFREPFFERNRSADLACLLVRFEIFEINLSVFEVRRIFDARRPAERQPCTGDAFTQRAAATMIEACFQYGMRAFQPCAAVGGQHCDARAVVHQFPHGCPLSPYPPPAKGKGS